MSESNPSSPILPHENCRVKICGVTQREQALAIAELGVDYLGLNFWPKSKRHLPLESALTWAREIPGTTKLVGLFVNAEANDVQDTAASVGLSFVQLHGDETPDFCARLVEQGLNVIKAIQVKDESSLDGVAAFPVQNILLDAYHPGMRGGIGETFPWKLAQEFKQRYPERHLWLAGGLTPENVAEAVAGVHPQVVDVASGVEDASPGVKNLEKVRRFIEATRTGAAVN
ncbi:phosphoribosylanthranilate isomerase [Roseimicrobium gellanilyticum]|uniref:N-(5'-phosphoribosyl)anthranilate isomerase n=1 Tax=Roseimicrobium gellanilyticum TaxID=748857 RepID=A0A366HHI5_9BACT|nr:phosphoribosylanthranilate isomerase [Roseimicrobium gellanilyticum]RBP41520.1 phosphoribosylanthranilate isomerase [Roseimicrobium gellanilyticum]